MMNLKDLVGKEVSVILDGCYGLKKINHGVVESIQGDEKSLTIHLLGSHKPEVFNTNIFLIEYMNAMIRVTYKDHSKTFLDFF